MFEVYLLYVHIMIVGWCCCYAGEAIFVMLDGAARTGVV